MTKIEQRRKLLAEATERPWSPDEHRDDVVVGSVYFLAQMIGPREEHAANAALIVAAVNDYAALLEGMEALKLMVDRWEPDTEGLDRVMWEKASAALAKWRGLP